MKKKNTKKYQSGGYPDLWPTNIPYLQGAFDNSNFNLAPLGQNFVNFGDNQFGAQIMGNIGKNSIYGDLFGGNAFKDPGKWGGDVAKGFETEILEQDKKKYGVTSFESAGLKWAKENGFSFSSPGEALKAYEKDIQGRAGKNFDKQKYLYENKGTFQGIASNMSALNELNDLSALSAKNAYKTQQQDLSLSPITTGDRGFFAREGGRIYLPGVEHAGLGGVLGAIPQMSTGQPALLPYVMQFLQGPNFKGQQGAFKQGGPISPSLRKRIYEIVKHEKKQGGIEGIRTPLLNAGIKSEDAKKWLEKKYGVGSKQSLDYISNDDAVDYIIENYLPKVKGLNTEDEIIAALDLQYNGGKDARIFAYQEWLREQDPNNTTKWMDENKKWKDRNNPPPNFDKLYNESVGKLKDDERLEWIDKGRDWYYRNIFEPALPAGKGYWGRTKNPDPNKDINKDYYLHTDGYYYERGADGSLSPGYGKTWNVRLEYTKPEKTNTQQPTSTQQTPVQTPQKVVPNTSITNKNKQVLPQLSQVVRITNQTLGDEDPFIWTRTNDEIYRTNKKTGTSEKINMSPIDWGTEQFQTSQKSGRKKITTGPTGRPIKYDTWDFYDEGDGTYIRVNSKTGDSSTFDYKTFLKHMVEEGGLTWQEEEQLLRSMSKNKEEGGNTGFFAREGGYMTLRNLLGSAPKAQEGSYSDALMRNKDKIEKYYLEQKQQQINDMYKVLGEEKDISYLMDYITGLAAENFNKNPDERVKRLRGKDIEDIANQSGVSPISVQDQISKILELEYAKRDKELWLNNLARSMRDFGSYEVESETPVVDKKVPKKQYRYFKDGGQTSSFLNSLFGDPTNPPITKEVYGFKRMNELGYLKDMTQDQFESLNVEEQKRLLQNAMTMWREQNPQKQVSGQVVYEETRPFTVKSVQSEEERILAEKALLEDDFNNWFSEQIKMGNVNTVQNYKNPITGEIEKKLIVLGGKESSKKTQGSKKTTVVEGRAQNLQQGGFISPLQQMMGYKDNSPWRGLPYQNFNTDTLTMDGVSRSLLAVPNNGFPQLMTPNSGTYKFPGATSVTEIPVKQDGGRNIYNNYTPSQSTLPAIQIPTPELSVELMESKQQNNESSEVEKLKNIIRLLLEERKKFKEESETEDPEEEEAIDNAVEELEEDMNGGMAGSTYKKTKKYQNSGAVNTTFEQNPNNEIIDLIKNYLSKNTRNAPKAANGGQIMNLSGKYNPFRQSPVGYYKQGGIISENIFQEPSRRYESDTDTTSGPMGPKAKDTPDYTNKGMRSLLEMPQNEFIPVESLLPIQTEKGEMIVHPTGDISKVMATKRHHQMGDDEVTDLAPPNSYILSAHGKVRIYKDEAKNIITEVGVKPYRLGDSQYKPTEKTLADFMKSSKETPAELAKKVEKAFPVLSTTNPFELYANNENKLNRKPYLEGIIQLSELDKERKGLNNNSNMEQMYQQGQAPTIEAQQGGGIKFPLESIVSSITDIWGAYQQNKYAKEAYRDVLGIANTSAQQQKQNIGIGSLAGILGVINQDPTVNAVNLTPSYLQNYRVYTPQSVMDTISNRAFANIPQYMQYAPDFQSGLAAQQAAYAQTLKSVGDARLQTLERDRGAYNQWLTSLQGYADANEKARVDALNATRLNRNAIVGNVGDRTQGMFDSFATIEANRAQAAANARLGQAASQQQAIRAYTQAGQNITTAAGYYLNNRNNSVPPTGTTGTGYNPYGQQTAYTTPAVGDTSGCWKDVRDINGNIVRVPC